jgi:hypothetical protein
MAEACRRYGPIVSLHMQWERETAKCIWLACRYTSEQLEFEWSRGMVQHHGGPAKHFRLCVRDNVIEIRCLTATAFGWYLVRRIVKDKVPTAYGFPVRATLRTECERDG